MLPKIKVGSARFVTTRFSVWVALCLLMPPESGVIADDGCRQGDAGVFDNIVLLSSDVSKVTVCPDMGIDPDKASYTKFSRWMRLDPTGLGSTAEIMTWDGMRTNRDGNNGLKAYLADSVRADKTLYEQALVFYKKLLSTDELNHTTNLNDTPIEGPATGKFDAWTEAKLAAGGDPYRALKIMAIFGHDNENNALQTTLKEINSNCVDRLDRLNDISPTPGSLLYRNNAIVGRWYEQKKDVEAGQAVANNCTAAADYDRCGHLSYRCNDYRPSYQADYYHVIFAAFAGCRARKFSVTAGTYAAKLAVERWLVKKYKYERFGEELNESATQGNPSERSLVSELRRALGYAYSDDHCALPADLKFGGPCANIAKAIAEREAFELCFRERQHVLGYDFGYNLAGCR